jgi:hypothetical protein
MIATIFIMGGSNANIITDNKTVLYYGLSISSVVVCWRQKGHFILSGLELL